MKDEDVIDTCPGIGRHEYRIQDGRIICAKHGYWLFPDPK